MSSSTEPEGVARNMLIVSTTLTGLSVLEYAWNLRFEMRVIWPQFWKSAEAKVFVLARYFGLAGQIFNIWFVNRIASGIPNHPLACIAWGSYQAVIIQTLLISVELLLMLRVCEMYNNDKYILGILLVFAAAQLSGMAVVTRMVVPTIDFTPTCVAVNSHPSQIYAGSSTVVVHLCILAMILWRFFSGNWPEQLFPYMKITVRDSIGSVIAVTVNSLPMILGALGVKLPTIENIIGFTMVFSFWFAVEYSIFNPCFVVHYIYQAGRLVLDKEKFRQQFQNDCELTEVDLDNLETLDEPDVCHARSYDSTVLHNKIPTAVNFTSSLGTEEDITDERPRDFMDGA